MLLVVVVQSLRSLLPCRCVSFWWRATLAMNQPRLRARRVSADFAVVSRVPFPFIWGVRYCVVGSSFVRSRPAYLLVRAHIMRVHAMRANYTAPTNDAQVFGRAGLPQVRGEGVPRVARDARRRAPHALRVRDCLLHSHTCNTSAVLKRRKGARLKRILCVVLFVCRYLSCHLQFAGAMAVAASGKPIQRLFHE